MVFVNIFSADDVGFVSQVTGFTPCENFESVNRIVKGSRNTEISVIMNEFSIDPSRIFMDEILQIPTVCVKTICQISHFDENSRCRHKLAVDFVTYTREHAMRISLDEFATRLSHGMDVAYVINPSIDKLSSLLRQSRVRSLLIVLIGVFDIDTLDFSDFNFARRFTFHVKEMFGTKSSRHIDIFRATSRDLAATPVATLSDIQKLVERDGSPRLPVVFSRETSHEEIKNIAMGFAIGEARLYKNASFGFVCDVHRFTPHEFRFVNFVLVDPKIAGRMTLNELELNARTTIFLSDVANFPLFRTGDLTSKVIVLISDFDSFIDSLSGIREFRIRSQIASVKYFY